MKTSLQSDPNGLRTQFTQYGGLLGPVGPAMFSSRFCRFWLKNRLQWQNVIVAIQKDAIRLALGALLLPAGAAEAGPPMVTDDTGTAADGTVEIIVYAEGESRDAGESAQLPALDVAVGIGRNLEIGLVLPRQRVKNAGENSIRSWGEATVGMKWRFFNRDDRALAFAPSLSMPLTERSTVLGIIDDTYILTLPLLASIRRGPWELTGNLGYSISSGTFDTISLGTSVGYQATARFRMLLEIWGADFVGDGRPRGFLNWRAGFEWAPGPRLTLLGATGGDVWSQLGAEQRLNHDFYVGLQYVFGTPRASAR